MQKLFDEPAIAAVPTLTGTGRIADDLYLLAHDDVSGKSFLQSRALGVGLSGALLAELVFAGSVWVQADQLQLNRQAQPRDYLGRQIFSLLLSERDWHPLRDWLLYLTAGSEQAVATRLGRAGYVREVTSRGPWRKPRWMPADADCAFASLLRVKAVMERGRPATVSDVVLSGLAVACGLGSRVLPFGPADARSNVETAIRKLHPAVRELIAQTQEIVDSALLSHRV